jgi:hypothetical protein
MLTSVELLDSATVIPMLIESKMLLFFSTNVSDSIKDFSTAP